MESASGRASLSDAAAGVKRTGRALRSHGAGIGCRELIAHQKNGSP